MPCYKPLKAWYGKNLTALGKRAVVFTRKDAYTDLQLELPCGRCIGCKLEKSRQWAMRCTHEQQLHKHTCFLTLTYSPENLPPFGTLVLKDVQNFLKRLRKALHPIKLRFFLCGEYGELEGRPHYHIILYGYDFPDKKPWRKTPRGDQLYRSPKLEKIWDLGASEIGSVTFESAAYVARYSTKKITGPMAADYYSRVDLDTGEVFNIKPEFATMSRRPGIGAGWFDIYQTDAYPKDSLVLRGKQMRPPRFYDNRYEMLSPEGMQKIRAKRKREGKKSVDNQTPERLAVREEIQLYKLKSLPRSI